MVTTGERLMMTGDGPRELLIVQTGADTAGQCLTMEAIYPPQTKLPPEHYHPEQEERFTVLAGTLTARLVGETRQYRVGATFVVPRGVAHTMHNAEDGEARVRWEVRPALRTAEFFAALAEETPAAGKLARLARLAAIMREYRRETVLSKPPLPVQRALFGVLAAFGGRRRDSVAMPGRREIHEQIVIARPAEEVFAYISDYERDPHWWTSVASLTQSTPGPASVGTITRETIRTFGQRIVTTGRIVALDPGRLIGFASIDGPIPVHGHRTVEPTPGGTLFTYYLAAELSGLYRLIGPLMERDLRGQVQGDLRRLKGLLEC